MFTIKLFGITLFSYESGPSVDVIKVQEDGKALHAFVENLRSIEWPKRQKVQVRLMVTDSTFQKMAKDSGYKSVEEQIAAKGWVVVWNEYMHYIDHISK